MVSTENCLVWKTHEVGIRSIASRESPFRDVIFAEMEGVMGQGLKSNPQELMTASRKVGPSVLQPPRTRFPNNLSDLGSGSFPRPFR